MRNLLLLLATAYISLTVPTIAQRFLKFTGLNGKRFHIDLKADPDMKRVQEITRNLTTSKYLLFTRKNLDKPQRLYIFDDESVKNSNFDASKEVAVVVHGWIASEFDKSEKLITPALLEQGDFNVIQLDWRQLAWLNYVSSTAGVPAVGNSLGRFLEWLSNLTGAPMSKMHLIGFSLGAHVVGIAGRMLNGTVARITGLDPAGPLWYLNPQKLRSSDAVYVEAIHTDAIKLGIGLKVGDVDFFPNGGFNQPGCFEDICNHLRSIDLFASTVRNHNLFGKRCTNDLQLILNFCNGDELEMGTEVLTKKYQPGSYGLTTKWRYPY